MRARYRERRLTSAPHRGRLVSACVVVIAVGLAGCSSVSGTMSQRLASWASQTDFNGANFDVADQQIAADLVNLANGVRQHDLKGLVTECQGFEADVQVIYGALPTPDRALTDEFNTAITNEWAPAAVACQRSTSFSSSDFARFQRDLAAGTTTYGKAKKVLLSFGVR